MQFEDLIQRLLGHTAQVPPVVAFLQNYRIIGQLGYCDINPSCLDSPSSTQVRVKFQTFYHLLDQISTTSNKTLNSSQHTKHRNPWCCPHNHIHLPPRIPHPVSNPHQPLICPPFLKCSHSTMFYKWNYAVCNHLFSLSIIRIIPGRVIQDGARVTRLLPLPAE